MKYKWNFCECERELKNKSWNLFSVPFWIRWPILLNRKSPSRWYNSTIKWWGYTKYFWAVEFPLLNDFLCCVFFFQETTWSLDLYIYAFHRNPWFFISTQDRWRSRYRTIERLNFMQYADVWKFHWQRSFKKKILLFSSRNARNNSLRSMNRSGVFLVIFVYEVVDVTE